MAFISFVLLVALLGRSVGLIFDSDTYPNLFLNLFLNAPGNNVCGTPSTREESYQTKCGTWGWSRCTAYKPGSDRAFGFSITSKCVSTAANTALGLMVAKFKVQGEMPYRTFTQLYDSTVRSIVEDGAVLWGGTDYKCINVLYNHVRRLFVGVGM